MTGDGNTDTRPGTDRPITRADLEAKFSQLRGSTTATETQRNIGLTGVIVAGVLLVLGASHTSFYLIANQIQVSFSATSSSRALPGWPNPQQQRLP